MSKLQIDIPYKQIVDFCARWKVKEFALFGSVLREDFRPESDIDVLVSFYPDARWSLFDLATMIEELEGVFGRKVDLLTRRGVERSQNYLRRKNILESAQVIHAA